MERHPKAGVPVKIANGPLKGRYFIVIDYLVNQYQGKTIEKIAAGSGGKLLLALKRRKAPIDNEVVFGKLYPTMEPTCVHDSELRVDLKEVTNEDGTTTELPPEVASLAEKKATKGGSSGKKSASKTDKSGSTPETPAKEEKKE